jgi:putative glutathione S-transferase
MPEAPRFASPVDVERFGPYRVSTEPGDPRPWLRFSSRITADGSSGFAADAGRYHIYAGSFCPYAQRALIARLLSGLTDDIMSVSFVDQQRDARGWAFRATRGPDPVNGFELLREAYEATEPGFDGHVSVPTLWDRVQGRVVSNDYRTIEIDLATQFRAIAEPVVELYPAPLRFEIDELDSWLAHAVDRGTRVAAGADASAELAERELRAAFASLDERLGVSRSCSATRSRWPTSGCS